ncbi:hypothetical protein [Rudanella lutea]|uniref:hypothetical protein n=1 Tax=Rudanella lutea TaxID=451374 RepID=UPI00036E3989|nr:hypothetical protein [Rudanella lutea]
MKTILTTMGLLLALAAATFAQSETNQTRENRPLIKEETKQEVREKAQEVKEDIREGARELEQNTRDTRQEIKQEAQQAGQEIKEEVREQVENTRYRNDRYGLPWFEKGSVMLGGSVGLGLGKGSGSYMVLNPRLGYFFQPGFMGGIRLSYDRRLSTSFRSQEVGVFARYYPIRTRISGFVGAGYNFGRERASNIGDNEKARFNSITLEVGTMFYVRRNLGVEASLETNYYDRSNPLAGRNRGGRAKVGINYYFARRVQ